MTSKISKPNTTDGRTNIEKHKGSVPLILNKFNIIFKCDTKFYLIMSFKD